VSSARPHNRGLRRSASPSAEVTRSLPIGRRPGRSTRCPFGPGSPSAGSSGSNPTARLSGSWPMKPRPSFGLGGREPLSDEGRSTRRLARRPRFGPAYFHLIRTLRSSIGLRRLPQFDPVALGVRDPPEATVLGLLDLSGFLDSFGPEGREHVVQVLHAVVDHERGTALTEVLRVRGEDGPDRGPSGLPVLPTPPREEGHCILDVHPQMTAVPLDQCLRILRLEG